LRDFAHPDFPFEISPTENRIFILLHFPGRFASPKVGRAFAVCTWHPYRGDFTLLHCQNTQLAIAVVQDQELKVQSLIALLEFRILTAPRHLLSCLYLHGGQV
jgi:hypothetical protein